MNTNKIFQLCDPKNQNLPDLKVKTDGKMTNSVYLPVFEGNFSKIKKYFPALKNEKFNGKKGEKKRLHTKDQIFYLIGMGKSDKANSRKMRRFFGSTYLAATTYEKKSIGFYCDPHWIKEAVIGINVAALDPSLFKPKHKPKKPASVHLIHGDFKNKKTYEEGLKMGHAIAEGKNLMRILGATPPNVLNPSTYGELAIKLAKKWKVKAERIKGKKLKDYGLINAVSSGSDHEPEMIIFTVHPKGKLRSKATKEATAIVGKGLCFDSGGNQSKGSYMKSMREDMGGSASTLGALATIVKGEMEVKETTYFALALSENMQDSAAMRPDDVYIAGDGQSVEIIHTDAEGRLALADTICYLKKNKKDIRRFYTIATLTGSCVSALGDIYTGSICNNDDLASEVTKTGKEIGDYVHIGPWDMDYDDNNSPIADVANLGQNSREAGWIKAGLFLYRFVPKNEKTKQKVEFCHFDIAGSIDMDEKGKSWRRKGFNSGACVTLLSKLVTK